MANGKQMVELDPEIQAISAVYSALSKLDSDAQRRVLDYVAGKLGITRSSGPGSESDYTGGLETREILRPSPSPTPEVDRGEAAEGISSVALKWMKRSGFSASGLSSLFSLGVDEIDLVAKTVPGEGKKDRMHSVLLLKGIAAYLSTGVPRVTHEQLKEACLHYDAYDSNFSTYLKNFAAEASGTKGSGYTLTPRGLTSATETIKSMTTPG
jgi:hypothetical protein